MSVEQSKGKPNQPLKPPSGRRMVKRIAATLAGLLIGGIAVGLIESISSAIYPPPEGFDFNNPQQLAEFAAQLPTGAFVIVLLAWCAGAFIAGFVARRLAPSRSLMPPVIALLILLAATIFNLAMIPHPIWMWIAGVVVWPLFGVAGMLAAGNPPESLIFECSRTVNAPLAKVFQVISNPDKFRQAVQGISGIEFLSECRHGSGTRFHETRTINGRTCRTTLEVVDFRENHMVRMVSDVGGAVWDTVFTVSQPRAKDTQPDGSMNTSTTLTMHMESRPHNVIARLLAPTLVRLCSGTIESDMDSVRDYCESLIDEFPPGILH
ncbi:MAG: hypothetical protein R3C20_22415 [Planctomycetaceae bacterium]